MRISATGSRRDLGFTLIEMMVVIAIIGLMSAAVIFVMPDPRGRLVDEAEKLAARAAAARDEAVICACEMRLRVTGSGYSFDRRRRGIWEPIAEKPLRPARWQDGSSADPAEASFDPTGVSEGAVKLVLRRGGERIGVTINGADVHVGT
jgi:general secretion pathway protein H